MNIRMLTLAVATALFALPLAAQAAAPQAQAIAGKNRVAFDTSIDAPALQLRVTGPGGFLREVLYVQGEPLSLPISSKEGWPDGQYRFELWPITGMAKRDGTAPVETGTAALPASGAFRVLGGEVIAPAGAAGSGDQDEAGTAKTQVIPEDLVVQGSACVGIDCTSTESFGFDTIRMKENNTRVKFEDTSTSAGFPSTDWQLTANDSASGGLNKFSIEDVTAARVPFTVEGGATTNSIYVDSTGRVGFRTSTPVLDLHVSTGNTPAMRLEQTSAGGFTAQTWDIGANEANFFVRDVTGGSRLSFRIRPGAPTSSIDIAADGDVGLGEAAPDSELHIKRANNGPTITMESTGTPARIWELVVRDSDGEFAINDPAAAGAEFIFQSGGNLQIAGTLTASGGATFPDYVFEPSYKLMPLTDLQQFIKDKGHLPNIPSAEDVQKAGGHNMTELQLRLLEKIEELTLYTLQQHDTISRLEGELAAMRSSLPGTPASE